MVISSLRKAESLEDFLAVGRVVEGGNEPFFREPRSEGEAEVLDKLDRSEDDRVEAALAERVVLRKK